MNDDKPRNNKGYHEALHAMQTGVAYELEHDPKRSSPKHLRTGINSAMINDAALYRLLVKKGLITEEEYMEELRLEANREVDRYEDLLRKHYGANISLG